VSVACLGDLDGNPAAAPLYALGIPPLNLGLARPLRPQGLLAVRRLIAERRPQIVHTHLGAADALGSLAARSLGVPLVSTIHAIGGAGVKDHLERSLLSRCAARIIAVSQSARRDYLRRGLGREDQVVTIHNGVDVVPAPGSGPKVREQLGLGPDDLVVGMVSALRPEKGHDVAIEAIRALRGRVPGLRLLIAGQGDLEGEIRRRAQDLDDVVVLAGLRSDVMGVLDAVDVCLHPSRADAFPTTLLEAMAASVPVLATAVGGIPEIVEDGRTGVLIAAPPTSPALADALAGLLADPARRARLGTAARASYLERFTAAPWLRALRTLYGQVLEESARGR
jgi:glycosyltransferase involved in cell wall biosynthesis